MGGPTASVLLREPVSSEELSEFDKILDAISSIRRGADLWILNTVPIGGNFVLPPEPVVPKNKVRWLFSLLCGMFRKRHRLLTRPFDIAFHPSPWRHEIVSQGKRIVVEEVSPEEIVEIQEGLGFVPAGEFSIGAFCGCPEDHRVLGEIVLYLAEKYNGIIELGGAIWPPLSPEVRKTLEASSTHPDGMLSWEQVEPYFKEMVAAMPGKIWTIHECHYADTEFMQGWLNHPCFHMIG